MEKYAFKIDGKAYNVAVMPPMKRNFVVMDTENTTRLLSGEIYRDVLGTYYNYSLTINNRMTAPEEYDAFYEVITSPVDFHILEFPYGQSTIEFQAYITNGSDDLNLIKDKNTWKNLTINFIAKEPRRLA